MDTLDPSNDPGSDPVPAGWEPAAGRGDGQAEPPAERTGLSPLAIAAAAIVAVVGALLFVGLSTGSDTPSPTEASASTELVSFEFTTESGSTATLSEYIGEPLVVNFFAAWCPPCRAELPDLERVHQARGDEVTFLGISHDLDETSWRSLIEEVDVTYDTVFQPNTEIFNALEAKGMPSTALVAPSGEVLHLHTGLLTDELLEDLIDQHLGGA